MSLPPTRSKRRLGLLLLAVVPYLNGLTGDFTYDDKVIIRDNERLESPRRAGEIFSTHYFGGPLENGTAYRPLILLTYAVQRWIHGNRPVYFHVVNVLIHAGVTLLLFEWLLRVGVPPDGAMATSALFATLTIHVEAVTSLVGRAEILAALLVLLSSLLWLLATAGERLLKAPYAGCLAAFLAGVFVKENAVVVPGVILLGELARDGSGWRGLRRVLSRHRWACLGLLLPLGALFGVRRLVLKGFLISKEAGIFDLENPLVALSPLLRAGNAATLVWRYVWKTVLPVGLSADHSAYALPLASRWGEPRAWAGLAGLTLAAGVTLILAKTRPHAAVGAAFFFGTLLPTANLLFPIGTLFAERLVYLPSAGLALIAVSFLSPPRREVPRPTKVRWRACLLASALLGFSCATFLRNRVWRSDDSLYWDMIEKVPNSAKARYNVAFDVERAGLGPEAERQLVKATTIFPRYYDAWALRGKLAWDDERWDEAIADYRRAVEIFPHYENGCWGLAKTLEEAGRPDEAEEAFDDGIEEFPESYPLAYHRAGFFEEEGRLFEAEAEWARAVKVGKGAALARFGHAKVLERLGRREPALDEARRALVADSGLVDARLFLADLYVEEGKILAAAAELGRAGRSRQSDSGAALCLLELARDHPEARGRAEAFLPAFRARFGRRPRDGRLAAAFRLLRRSAGP